ncbi:MAG: D-alanine--D-alanine ligase, partial [Chloroherpetonaceae bacterium]|nr:D-alanine--D-alanine ligase [Chloroherpetonaceae bacterium]
KIGYPMFVKPARSGSSVGISKVKNRAQLQKALQLAGEYDEKILVEQGIDARELEVSVLGNRSLEVSVVGEIVPVNEFYDYEAKYVKSGSQLIIPAELPKRVAEKARAAAATAFRATGCEGMARVDFFLERKTNRLYINEINSIPGFTSISMYPKLFEASGVPYPELIDRLITLAFERYEAKKKNKIAFL